MTLLPPQQCKIHWQSNGDYLCVKVDRHTKTGKTRYCNLELFRLREKDCPVQVIEIKGGFELSLLSLARLVDPSFIYRCRHCLRMGA